MKVKELKSILNSTDKHDDDLISIRLSSPSMGPVAMSSVRWAGFGFDWEKGHLLISPAHPLVKKSEREEVWDLAFDLIYVLSKEVSHKGNPTSMAKRCQAILQAAKELCNPPEAKEDD